MSKFSPVKLTLAGLRLQGKMQAGHSLTFTRAAVGDGYLGGADILALSGLIHPVDVPVSLLNNTVIGDGTTALTIRVQNGSVPFYFREIGIMARDPDTKADVLYAYTNAGDYADFFPQVSGTNHIVQDVILITQTGNAETVDIHVDLTAEVTKEEFLAHTSQTDIHIPVYFTETEPAGDQWLWFAPYIKEEQTKNLLLKTTAYTGAGDALHASLGDSRLTFPDTEVDSRGDPVHVRFKD